MSTNADIIRGIFNAPQHTGAAYLTTGMAKGGIAALDLLLAEHAAEVKQLRDWKDSTLPLIAALAIYGEEASLAALVEKARKIAPSKAEEVRG